MRLIMQILARRSEYNRDRRGDAYLNSRRRQAARALVDAEHHDISRILVGGEKEFAAGVNGEIAGRLAACRSPPLRCQRASVARIHSEDGDAVVAAIGGVY